MAIGSLFIIGVVVLVATVTPDNKENLVKESYEERE